MLKEAFSYDLDGVVVNRRIPIQIGSIKARLGHGIAMYDRTLSLVPIERSVDPNKIKSKKEAISYIIHSTRGLKRGVVEKLAEQSADKYGNTGRSNKQQWVEMTWKQLKGGGLTNFKDVFFTPTGIGIVLSKGAGIQELSKRYDKVTHFDDDPLTVLLLAKHFRDVNFVLVEDLSAGFLLSGVNWADYENVTRVKKLDELVMK